MFSMANLPCIRTIWPLSNVFPLPHLGSAIEGMWNAMRFCAPDNLEAFFKGDRLPNVVKFDWLAVVATTRRPCLALAANPAI